MIRKAILLAAALLLSGVVFAQEGSKQSVSIKGLVIDNMCNTGKGGTAKGHTVSCALMPDCQASGYAVIEKEKSYKFDAEGNKRVLEILKTTKTKKGVMVEVAGTLNGDVLSVDSISEIIP